MGSVMLQNATQGSGMR